MVFYSNINARKPVQFSSCNWRSKAKMRPASVNAFRSQVHAIQTWFNEWNDCERTIALYSLLRQMKPIHARFLSVVLEHTFRDHSYQTQIYESQANDKDFISSLSTKSNDDIVRQLLVHLPLLQPGNHLAREEYLKILPSVLAPDHKSNNHEDECRQLLSLALVHPAFSPKDRSQLQQLQQLQQLDDNCGLYDPKMNDFTPPDTVNRRTSNWQRHALEKKDSGLGSFEHHTGPPTFTSMTLPQKSHPNLVKSQSLNSAVMNPPREQKPMGNGCDDMTGDSVEIIVNRPGRSLSFPVDPQKLHKPLSPQSSVESETEEANAMLKMSNYPENPNPGMRDYLLWLKGLRLHKYYSLFSKITYEDMFKLTDAVLESKNVTKGAKTKILLSVQKLTERSQLLSRLEKEVHEEGKLPLVLESLKTILMSPIKPFMLPLDMRENMEHGGGADKTTTQINHPDDLPAQLTKVIGQACTQLLVSKPNEENFQVYISLLEKALSKEAFTPTQKKRLQLWKQQCHVSAKRFNPRRSSQDRTRYPFHAGDSSSLGCNMKRQRGSQRGLNKLVASNSTGLGGATGVPIRSNTTEGYYKPRLMRNHALVSRTKSAPVPASKQRQHLQCLSHQASVDSVEGIHNSLESLCLSVTEHALADNTDSN